MVYSLLLALSFCNDQLVDKKQAFLYQKDQPDCRTTVSIMSDHYDRCLDDILRLNKEVRIWQSIETTADNNRLSIQMPISQLQADGILYADIYYDHGLIIDFSNNTEKLSSIWITGIVDNIHCFLSAITSDHSITIAGFISLVNRKNLSVYERINKTDMPIKNDATCLFELLRPYRTLEQVAVTFGEDIMTYKDLFTKASQFAQFLYQHRISKGSIVGLLMERRLEWCYCILGIMQIGAVCMPLNVNQPSEQINKIVADSNAECIITSEQCYSHVSDIKVYCLDSISLKDYKEMDDYERCLPEENAYIIYTSGSTNHPKGIILNHRGIMNHIYTKIQVLNLNSDDRFAHNVNFGFVASIWLLFVPLLLNSTIVLYDEKTSMDPVTLFLRAAKDRVTVLEVVPWLLSVFLKFANSPNTSISLGRIRHLILTGEKVPPHIVNEFHKRYTQNLFNAYGQSECSDDTLHYLFDANKTYHQSIIGKPSNNTQIYIFGPNLDLKPKDQAGILYIGGDSLANGYIPQTEVMQDVWITNPLNPCEKLFKTNDLVRLTEEDTVEYLGRVDNQVKLRGNRIELENIGLTMIQHQNIIDAAVIDITDNSGNTLLCGFYQSDSELEIDSVNEFLKQKLPTFMLLGCLVRLQSIPRNENGKIDYPLLRQYDVRSKTDNIKESNIEHSILALYKDILHENNLGGYDDFFKLGGDSLQVIRLFNVLSSQYPNLLTIGDLYIYTTPNALADFIRNRLTNG